MTDDRNMRIAVDARTVYSPTRRGTGKNLIDLYRHIAALRPAWEVLMLHRCADVSPAGELPDPFADLLNVRQRRIEMPGDRWGLWQGLRLPWAARSAGADVLHCPANFGPAHPRAPMVLTIHDVIPLDHPGSHPNPSEWGRAVGRAARAATKIITPSAYSKGRIAEVFSVPPEKIAVNHWASDEACRQVTDATALATAREKYGVAERPYVLVFGGRDPRKNTEGILRAWALLDERVRREHWLLIIGVHESARGRFQAIADELHLSDGVRVCGFVPEADLPAVLSGAEALCFASLLEGFGLPILDAFACRTAVVSGDNSSLPEVAGDAAVLVDAARPEAIADGLSRVLADAGLREQLAQRGALRVEQFTWEACARRAIAVLEDASGERT